MDDQSAAIVLIHGLWMNGLELGLLRRRLVQRTGWPTEVFSYRSVSQALSENASRLRRRLDDIDAQTIHLVGHSLGGVLALQMLNLFPTDRVRRVVCLGSPLVDSKAARSLGRWSLGRRMLGRTLRAGLIEQRLVSVVGNREVGVIAGTFGVGLGAVITRLESPHDGVVSVCETRLPGITDYIDMPVNHFGLVFSSKVADRIAHFLRYGKFR